MTVDVFRFREIKGLITINMYLEGLKPRQVGGNIYFAHQDRNEIILHDLKGIHTCLPLIQFTAVTYLTR